MDGMGLNGVFDVDGPLSLSLSLPLCVRKDCQGDRLLSTD